LKIYPNIILPSTPGSPQRPLSLRFPHQNITWLLNQCNDTQMYTQYRSLNTILAQPKNRPFRFGTKIELQNVTTTCHKNGILWGTFWLRIVPLLSDFKVKHSRYRPGVTQRV
jgi:hypothetical protein